MVQRHNYNSLKQLYTSSIKNAKVNVKMKTINASKIKGKALWNLLKSETKSRKPVENLKLDKNGNVTDDPAEIVNIFLDVFTPKITLPSGNTVESVVNNNSMFLFPTTEEEVAREINSLGSSSATGFDGIPTSVLKYAINSISKPLAHCVNLFFECGVYPDVLKHSIVFPLHKKGSKTDANNYRGIFLSSNIGKLIEKLVNKRLVEFLETNDLVAKNQHGFTKGKSTTTATTELISGILSEITADNTVLVLFIDFTKAFDSCSHSLLLEKLEAFGVRGTCLQFFQSYLRNRTLSVRYAHQTRNECEIEMFTQESKSATVNSGVFAGTILGPVLFNVFVNSLFQCLKNVRTTAYADDFALVLSVNDPSLLQQTTCEVLGKLSVWSSKNGLKINASKTKYMLFNCKLMPALYIKLYGQTLEHVKVL